MINKIVYLAFLLNFSLLNFANADQFKTDSAGDPTAQINLYKKAETRQTISAVVHGVAAIACFTYCQACSTFSTVATGLDVVGALAIKDEQQDIMSTITPLITPVMGSFMMGGGMALSTKKSNYERTNKEDRDGTCIKGAAMQALQAGYFVIQAKQSAKNAKEASDYRAEVRTEMPTMSSQLSSGGGPTDQVSDTSSVGYASNSSPAAKADAIKAELKSSAASAALEPMLRQFNKATGKTLDDIINGVANGENPMTTISSMAAPSIGEGAASGLNELANKAAEETQRRINQQSLAGGAEGYEAIRHGGSGSGKKEDGLSGMLAGMMKGMMGGQGGEQGAGALGPKQIGFGAQLAAKKLADQGLHTPTESIFDVVGNRYQRLTNRFLNEGAQTAVRTPASLLPKNVYLRK